MDGRPLHAHLSPLGDRFVAAVADAMAGGPAVLPVPPGPQSMVAAVLAELRPHAVVAPDGGIDARPDPMPCPAEVAAVVPTSGSTGVPKGVELPAAALAWSASATLDRLEAGPRDRWLCCLPLYHVGGLQVLVRSLVAQTTPVMSERFDPGALAGTDATFVALVPTMLHRVIRDAVDIRQFKAVLLGGAGAPPALLDAARAAGVNVVVTYGMTETCGGCVYDGSPLRGVRVEIDGDQRVHIHGRVLARGYRLRPDLTRAAFHHGALRTDDIGRLAADGRLEVLGRADEVIISGGKNIHPQRVEAILAGHPAVREAVLVGVPDPEWGDRVVAVVVPAHGTDPPTLEALRRHVGEQAEAWAAPRELRLVDDLPRLPSGKVDRRTVEATTRS